MGALRRRVDELREVVEGAQGIGSANLDTAIDRLELAVEGHFAASAPSQVLADRLVDALDVIPQGIVLADADGDIVFRNRTAAGYLSARHGDALVGSLIGELIASAVAGETTTRTIDLFGPPRRSLQLRSVPLEAVDGEADPSPGGAFLVVEDVSERQRLESVRRDFVANISHELKTPVGALSVLAETLTGETDAEVVARLADRMVHEAARVAQTIDDLLELSRIEAGDAFGSEQVRVSAVVSEAVDRISAGAESHQVEIVVHPIERSLVVTGDRRQLVSAVSNLCDNAVKYSEPGAVVEVSARQVQPDDGPATVEVEVVDHGVGIPANDLGRIFERFYRVDRARSRDTGGTGLGLAIVNHVAQNHHGTVTVSSHEGEGSTFTLHVPVLPPSRTDLRTT